MSRCSSNKMSLVHWFILGKQVVHMFLHDGIEQKTDCDCGRATACAQLQSCYKLKVIAIFS